MSRKVSSSRATSRGGSPPVECKTLSEDGLDANTFPPADDTLLAHARQVADRLRSEINALLALIPPDARGGSALARWLDIDRATCQRVVAAARADGIDVLTSVPGVQGLATLVTALATRIPDKGRIAAAEVAIDQYDKLIRSAGGSRAELIRRLDAAAEQDEAISVEQAIDDRDARERLFLSARRLIGRWSHASVCLQIYRPLPGDASLMQSVGVTGFIGHRARPDGVPLTLTVGNLDVAGHALPGSEFQSLDESPVLGHSPTALLAPFSTCPAPLITSQVPGKDLVQLVDSTAIDPSCGADIVLARRHPKPVAHPATESPPIHEVWVLMNYPARHLLMDVYLHRSMARQCIPSLSNHLWTLNFDESVGKRWSTRFGRAPRLEILSDRPAPTRVYPRQLELTEYVFDRIGWGASEFVGYRCAVEFPMWRIGYCMSFDFTRDEQP